MGNHVTELKILKSIIMSRIWLMLSCITYISASPVLQDLRFPQHEMNRANNIPQRCENNTITPVSCANVNSTDGLLPHPDDCQLFYYCIIPDLPPICRQCPASLHFNPVLHVCDYPQQAGCQINITTTTTPPITTDPELTTTDDIDTTWVTITIPDEWNTTTESPTETMITSNNTTEDYTTTEAATTTTVMDTPTTTSPWPTTVTSESTGPSERVPTTTNLPPWTAGTSSIQETETSSTTASTIKWKFQNAGEIKYSNTLEIV